MARYAVNEGVKMINGGVCVCAEFVICEGDTAMCNYTGWGT